MADQERERLLAAFADHLLKNRLMVPPTPRIAPRLRVRQSSAWAAPAEPPVSPRASVCSVTCDPRLATFGVRCWAFNVRRFPSSFLLPFFSFFLVCLVSGVRLRYYARYVIREEN